MGSQRLQGSSKVDFCMGTRDVVTPGFCHSLGFAPSRRKEKVSRSKLAWSKGGDGGEIEGLSLVLVLLLVPLSKTLLEPPSKEPALLGVIPPSRFAHQDQLSWARKFPGISMLEPDFPPWFSPHSPKDVLQLPSEGMIPTLAIIRFLGRCFVMHQQRCLLWSFPSVPEQIPACRMSCSSALGEHLGAPCSEKPPGKNSSEQRNQQGKSDPRGI